MCEEGVFWQPPANGEHWFVALSQDNSAGLSSAAGTYPTSMMPLLWSCRGKMTHFIEQVHHGKEDK